MKQEVKISIRNPKTTAPIRQPESRRILTEQLKLTAWHEPPAQPLPDRPLPSLDSFHGSDVVVWGTHLSGHRSFCTPHLSPVGARAEVKSRLSLRILVPNQRRPCLKTLHGHDYHEPRTLASLPSCQASRSPAVTGSLVETQHTAKGREAMGRSLLTQREHPPSPRTAPAWDLEYWDYFLPFSLAAPPTPCELLKARHVSPSHSVGHSWCSPQPLSFSPEGCLPTGYAPAESYILLCPASRTH